MKALFTFLIGVVGLLDYLNIGLVLYLILDEPLRKILEIELDPSIMSIAWPWMLLYTSVRGCLRFIKWVISMLKSG